MSCTNSCCFRPSEPLTDLHWSRLELLLRENQTPSNVEKQTFAKVEQDIERYDLAIARLQSAIVSLESQRDAAKEYVRRHESLLAPIRRLSNDALVEIFTYVCTNAVLDNQDDTCLPQLLLCQVCRHWRSLVNATPLLWSMTEMVMDPTPSLRSITEMFTEPSPQSVLFNAAQLEIVNLFLTKSRNCPLTIRAIDFPAQDHPLSALLLRHSNRWASALLSLAGGNEQFSFPGLDLHRLRHLELRGDTRNVQIPAMPSLESLVLNCPATPLNFPWTQLRKLKLTRPLLSECASIIPLCTQLQHVTLTSVRGENDTPITPIVSHTIVSMTVLNANEQRFGEIFRLLKFSQLRTMDLENCCLPPHHPFPVHAPPVTSLSLRKLESLGGLLELLRALPTLTDFSLHTWSSATLDDFFSELLPAYPPDSRTLLPRLTRFNMRVISYQITDFNAVASAFVRMVKSRAAENQSEKGLKCIRFSLPCCCLNHDLLSPLAYLPKVGISISVQDQCGFIL